MSILGIDFGATKIVAAYFDAKTQKSEIILDNEENRSTACCLAFTKTERLFSKAAEYQAVSNPENTIFGRDIKLIIGNDYKIETFIKSDLNPDNERELKLTYRNEEIKIFPEHMIAMLLSRLRENAEKRLGRNFSQAVVSVPAMFNAKQRNALKTACSAAGLEVKAFLNNTTAAAIHYAVERKFSGYSRKILIFDMGATSFEVGVFEIRNNSVTTLACDGSLEIGGENFVDRLKSYFLQQMRENYMFIEHDNEKLSRLHDACEKVKTVLSTTNLADVKVEAFNDGQPYEFKMYRDEFEYLCKDLFEKIHEIVHETTKNICDIEEFIVIGGGGRIPKVEETLKNALKIDHLSKVLNQDESVANGTAYYAAKSDIFSVHEVTATEFLIESEKSKVVIARKGKKLPISHEITFKHGEDSYPEFRIYQDFHHFVSIVSFNEYLTLKTDVDSNGLVKIIKNEGNEILNLQSIPSNKVEKMKNLDKNFESTEKLYKTLQVKLNALESKCYKYKRTVDSKDLFEVLTENDKFRVKELCENTLEWIKYAQYATKDDIISKQEELDEICFNLIEQAQKKHAQNVLETSANQYFSNKDFERAIDAYTKLIEQSKENDFLVLAYRCNRGRALYYLKRWEEAIKDFNFLLDQSYNKSNLEECRFYRAKCYFLLENFDASLKDLDYLLRANDLKSEFRNGILTLKVKVLLVTYGRSKEYGQNSLEISKIDELMNDYPFMQYLKKSNRNLLGEMFLKRATCKFSVHFHDKALEDLEKAADYLDNHGEIFKLRAQCFFILGKIDQAEQEIQSCLLVTDEGSELRSDIVMLSAEIEKSRKEQTLKRELKEFERLRAENAYEDVVKIMKKIKNEHRPLPKNIRDEFMRAEIVANYHHFKKAREGIQDCSSLLIDNMKDLFALRYRAKFYLADKCKWQAERDLNKILSINPDDQEAIELLNSLKQNGFWNKVLKIINWNTDNSEKKVQKQFQSNGDELGANSDDEGPNCNSKKDTVIDIGESAEASNANVTKLRKKYETNF
ncbi:heat shock 70 kDa protein cognate 4-like isoform X2 [Culicoides brevitarsis]|uniref:heat shock 70 kDa protein cognate 4-like isoform X2 n=1 Tax=Culicoides brevitarsis TaxID=469753 RepID=UPI00307C4CC6